MKLGSALAVRMRPRIKKVVGLGRGRLRGRVLLDLARCFFFLSLSLSLTLERREGGGVRGKETRTYLKNLLFFGEYSYIVPQSHSSVELSIDSVGEASSNISESISGSISGSILEKKILFK